MSAGKKLLEYMKGNYESQVKEIIFDLIREVIKKHIRLVCLNQEQRHDQSCALGVLFW